MLFLWIILWSFIQFIHQTEAAKILCVSVDTPSHTDEVAGAAERLQDYGHEVYIVVSNSHHNPERYKNKGFTLLTYDMPEGIVYLGSDAHDDRIADTILSGGSNKDVDGMVLPLIYRDCVYMMADRKLLKTIRKLEFDLVIVDGYIFCPCNLILPEYLGLPFVVVSSTFHPLHARIPTLPNFVPTIRSEFSDKMTIAGKFQNTILTMLLMNLPMKQAYDVSLLRTYNIKSSWDDILKKATLFVTPRDYILEWPHPVMPHYIAVPGLGGMTPKQLPYKFAKLMDNPSGVIVMSFGPVSKLANDVILKFLYAFARLDQTVIWKLRLKSYQDTDLPSNVHIFPDLPQVSLLAHPNTSIFITHCGKCISLFLK